ncbi:glutamate decarboxylase [Lichtheimia corymbifera JMRC:FSU:9682]|uniref:Glutamate decarboxylase n=1 Tax=Lichtheimia corymbifera JMRC:FSU:9682 TaxID=1263082 RepID=A0A068RY51_9FUNG|nr:glutamate decarboxylase [Lichtheimia corymbifera JMRC:FSU:9682]
MAYSSRYAVQEIPKYKLPKSSTEAKVAYQLIHDELELDGRPSMNLASFVHTWMEDEADKLVYENIAKNLSDQDEYPATMTIQGRCISIIGNLWHAEAAIGTATVGSSEAVMLGGLALKKRWQERQRKNGKDTSRPNIIMGNNAQVALEKFARYFDVEMRLIPVSEESHHILDIHKAVEACDENTIGIFCILGSTFTGHFEDVLGLSKLLDDYEAKTGLDIAIHVDAASGGFVAPFAFPDLKWDFRLKRVVSINASGHKFGLSYCGIGWVLWRSTDYLPKELVFQLDYLGSIEYTYNLNFSRPACFMISQYYNFIRLGHEGYKRVMENDLKNARLFAYALEETGSFDVVSDLHRPLNVFGWHKTGKEQVAQAKKKGAVKYNPALPVVSFKLNDEFKKKYPHVQQAAISTLLRTKGWIVPNYKLPPAEDDTEILRVVVRESLSREMIDRLVIDVREAADKLKEVENEASQMLADVTGVSTKNKHEAHEHRNVKRPKTFNSTC